MVELLMESPPSQNTGTPEETIMQTEGMKHESPKITSDPPRDNEHVQQGKTCQVRSMETGQVRCVKFQESQVDPGQSTQGKVLTCEEPSLPLDLDQNDQKTFQFDSTVTHGNETESAIHDSGTADPGGRISRVQGDSQPGWTDHETSRNHHAGGMGQDTCSIGKAFRQDIPGDIRSGFQLCFSTEEQTGSVGLGSQFPDVCQGTQRDHQPPAGDRETTTDADSTKHDDRDQQGVDKSPLSSDTGGRGNQQKGGAQTISQRGEVRDERREESGQDHRSADQDRCAPTRACPGDRKVQFQWPVKGNGRNGLNPLDRVVAHIMSDGPLKGLKPQEESKNHDAIKQRTMEIEQILHVWENDRKKGLGKTKPGENRRQQSCSRRQQVDLLEVYCEPNSQLSNQVNSMGGCAIRFSRMDGDLTTTEGVQKLWTWIMLYEPRHVWVAPDCRLWGMFSRFNMGRGTSMFEKIQCERQQERCHLQLCNDIYLHQVGLNRHFHLEQPHGSEMMDQPDLSDTKMGTLQATFDMCQVGKLRLPNHEKYLQKKTCVHTTSRRMFEGLHQRVCKGEHGHDHIKGKTKIHGKCYAKAYTGVFARQVAKIVCQTGTPENPLMVEEMILGLEEHEKPEMASEALQLQKRRRVYDKQPETSMYGRAPTWEAVFGLLDIRLLVLAITILGKGRW